MLKLYEFDRYDTYGLTEKTVTATQILADSLEDAVAILTHDMLPAGAVTNTVRQGDDSTDSTDPIAQVNIDFTNVSEIDARYFSQGPHRNNLFPIRKAETTVTLMVFVSPVMSAILDIQDDVC